MRILTEAFKQKTEDPYNSFCKSDLHSKKSNLFQIGPIRLISNILLADYSLKVLSLVTYNYMQIIVNL